MDCYHCYYLLGTVCGRYTAYVYNILLIFFKISLKYNIVMCKLNFFLSIQLSSQYIKFGFTHVTKQSSNKLRHIKQVVLHPEQ